MFIIPCEVLLLLEFNQELVLNILLKEEVWGFYTTIILNTFLHRVNCLFIQNSQVIKGFGKKVKWKNLLKYYTKNESTDKTKGTHCTHAIKYHIRLKNTQTIACKIEL